MEKEINELCETLKIVTNENEDYPNYYDTNTPYEKCGITISVPTTVGSSTVIQRKL